MIYRWITTWHLEEYANWPFVGSTHDVYKSKDILCRSEGNLPRVFFQNLSRDFHRRMVALAASGFNKKRALLDKALEELGVGRRVLVLTLQDVLVYLVRFQQNSVVILWMVHLKKLRELLWCFVQSVKYLLARGTQLCHLERNASRKLSAVTGIVHPRSSSTTGGWTHQRPHRRVSLREIRRKNFPITGIHRLLFTGESTQNHPFSFFDSNVKLFQCPFSYFWSRTGGLGGGRCHGNHEEKHTRRQPAGEWQDVL